MHVCLGENKIEFYPPNCIIMTIEKIEAIKPEIQESKVGDIVMTNENEYAYQSQLEHYKLISKINEIIDVVNNLQQEEVEVSMKNKSRAEQYCYSVVSPCC